MKGNIDSAAWTIGFCMILSTCMMAEKKENAHDDNKITYAYCAGLKTGQALKGAILND